MCVCLCGYVYKSHVEARGQLWVSFFRSCMYTCMYVCSGSLTRTLDLLIIIAGHPAPRICLSPPLECWNYEHMSPCPTFL